ncbi:molybdenum-dependent transcriptional regulator [Xenorhabdus kozodoii]|uniref:Molybdenum-dependent transcriptional regulator n=1 Tax=Xenorhabdus kozodoii TaxID=351676 RepID=A0A2D0LG98_9GAMM|nr:molybdenum-dependent transcriptional regulator [Xenorhabdus kozodoii]PHM74719.1 molybdenum-dependent transcriptional regulator [Xenorhabdus kozodoii]
MQAQILLTLKLQQRLFADPRRIKLLKQIKITGSISQGARQAGISYKSAWDAISEMNQLADELLVERATGGKGGGGAQLTHYGERLVQLYDLLEKIQQKAFDVLTDDSLPLDSLLAAISRFSLQTSARNQFFGTIIERDQTDIQQHVRVLLSGSKTLIYAAVTGQSADRLNLVAGKEVLVLIKAPWITLTKDHVPSAAFGNVLPSQVSHVETGTEYSEIILTLDGGDPLCVTLPNQEMTRLQLQPRDSVTAFFNADKVIIATLC